MNETLWLFAVTLICIIISTLLHFKGPGQKKEDQR